MGRGEKRMKAEEKELKELIISNLKAQEPNELELEKHVFKISVSGLSQIDNLIPDFVNIYPDPDFQNRIFDIILSKIRTHEEPEQFSELKQVVCQYKLMATGKMETETSELVNLQKEMKQALLVTQNLEASESKELELKKYVLEMSASGLSKIDNLIYKFVNSYEDPDFQNIIFDIILSKIETEENELNYETFSSLKKAALTYKAKAIVNINEKETREQVKFDGFFKALKLLENANAIDIFYMTQKIQSFITTLISEYPIPTEAFQLAQYSLKFRHDNLTPDHLSILEAYRVAAMVGSNIEDRAIKVQVMQYANEAYNMAMRLGDKVDTIKSVLKILADAYKYFGDNAGAKELQQQINAISKDSTNKTEISVTGINAIEGELLHNPEIIRKRGVIDDLTLKIKEQIQKSVLNPVSEAAAHGKWINSGFLREYGVSGYLGIGFLIEQLGAFDNREHTEIALMLCFEAINLGINSSKDKNPVCAAIFAQTYHDLIPKILEQHPEYFVDGHIIRAVIFNADNINRELLGIDVELNEEHNNQSGYNKYLEKVMMPIIETRIKKALDSVGNLIKSGEWNPYKGDELLRYASNESHSVLPNMGRMPTKLGKNLGMLDDSENMLKILVFKKVVDSINESKSENYAPVKLFVEKYPELITRILSNHPEYVSANAHIKEICEQKVFTSYGESIVSDICGSVNDPLLSESLYVNDNNNDLPIAVMNNLTIEAIPERPNDSVPLYERGLLNENNTGTFYQKPQLTAVALAPLPGSFYAQPLGQTMESGGTEGSENALNALD